jgi:hypothetical protein
MFVKKHSNFKSTMTFGFDVKKFGMYCMHTEDKLRKILMQNILADILQGTVLKEGKSNGETILFSKWQRIEAISFSQHPSLCPQNTR